MDNEATRVEKHIIKPNNKYYKILDEYCFKSKNLYNLPFVKLLVDIPLFLYNINI